MSREKQIEEMARIIGHCESTLHPDIECHNKATGCYCIENPCHNQRIADKLYTAGYRKQSEGEWIEERYIDEKRSDFKCSVCEYDDTFYRNSIHRFYKYCPYCGAKMKGGVQE